MITKSVNPDEVGKIFAIVGTFQALVPFASSPLFGFLYRATVATFPAAFLFLVSAFKFVEMIVVIIVFIHAKKDEKKAKEILELSEKQKPLLFEMKQEKKVEE